MGHEMGHYVLNHAYKGLVMFGVLVVIGVRLLELGHQHCRLRAGERGGESGE